METKEFYRKLQKFCKEQMEQAIDNGSLYGCDCTPKQTSFSVDVKSCFDGVEPIQCPLRQAFCGIAPISISERIVQQVEGFLEKFQSDGD